MLSAQTAFTAIYYGSLIVPGSVALIIALQRIPKSAFIRGAAAIVAGWLIGVVYTAIIYNPAAIAAATASGEHFPESRFDNNTVASSILGGWIVPATIVVVVTLWRRTKRRTRQNSAS